MMINLPLILHLISYLGKTITKDFERLQYLNFETSFPKN